MEAVRIREGVETEERVLTGAAIVERQDGRVRVQQDGCRDGRRNRREPKHYRFTLRIEFAPVKLQSWKRVLTEAWLNGLKKPGELQREKSGKKQQKKSTTISKRQQNELRNMADIFRGAI